MYVCCIMFIIFDMGWRIRFFLCSVYFVGLMFRLILIVIFLIKGLKLILIYISFYKKINIKILFKYDLDLIFKRNVEKYNNLLEIYLGWFWWIYKYNGSGNYGIGRYCISGICEEVYG